MSLQRMLLAGGFAVCAALMAAALWLQHVEGLEPCPLCVLQRGSVIALGVVMLAGAAHDPGTLGRRVQELRKQRGWSQQRLASAAGLDRTYLGTVEQGKQNITIGAALKLADALDTSLGELIDPG